MLAGQKVPISDIPVLMWVFTLVFFAYRQQGVKTLFFQNNFLSTQEYQTRGTNSRSRLIRTSLKASIKLQNIVSMKKSIILVLILQRYKVLP